MNIPFVDLKTQYHTMRSEINDAIQNVIEKVEFIGGKNVTQFEKSFADMCNVQHCISVGNGTDALYITLKMLGIGVHDEVITVANSWISTAEIISGLGARPIFIDIEPEYYNINPNLIEKQITPRTKAILPVHLFGQPADLEPIVQICHRLGLYLVEDCAQAHFAKYHGLTVGSVGVAGCFSFYPGKNLGAYGDGGCIVTSDDELAEKVRMYANHGALVKHEHKFPGTNSRLDGMQAAILNTKLPYITEWNKKRHHRARLYHELLANIQEIKLPKIRPDATHVFHIYCIRAQRRDDLRRYLHEHGIQTAVHYPKALPYLEAYKHLAHTAEDFPISYAYQHEILSLPMYPELSYEEQEYVASIIRDFYRL